MSWASKVAAAEAPATDGMARETELLWKIIRKLLRNRFCSFPAQAQNSWRYMSPALNELEKSSWIVSWLLVHLTSIMI